MISVLVTLSLVFLVPLYAKPNDPVFELTDLNFDHDLKNKEVMLIDFYAPWCSDCTKLKPDFDAAARDLAGGNRFVFAKVDCFGKGKGICTRLGIHSWPQLKVFRFGQYAGEYSGYQDKNSLVSFTQNLLKQQQWQSNLMSPRLPQIQDQPASNGMTNVYAGQGWALRPMGCIQPCAGK